MEGSLSFLVQGVTILGSLLFVTGWRYAHAYYGVFGVGLSQLEIPTAYFFVLIQLLVFESPLSLVLPPILTFLIPWLIPQLFKLKKLFRKQANPDSIKEMPRWIEKLSSINKGHWTFLVLLVFLLVSPFQAAKIGYAHAERDLNPDNTHLPIVSVKLKTPSGEGNLFLLRLRGEGISDGEYLFLGRHRGIYLLVPIRRLQGMRSIHVPRVLMLPESIIASVSVEEES